MFCVLFLNDLYEHHCYRKYSDKLDESSEGFFWEEFYHTDSEQGSDSYYREHQEVQRKRAPVDVVPGKDLERNFQQIDNEKEPGVNADVFHLLLAHREPITDITGPAALPIIVVKPPSRPKRAESTPILYNNFREKVVLKDVADFVGQNPTSLCRYFKKSTDKSIFEVLAEIRVEYACKLLANSDLTISEVAFSSGYNTPTLFFEQFQKIIHLTPAEYRREINGTAK